MAVKEIFEGNTADVIEATEKLLAGLPDRTGVYVWKKYGTEQMTITLTHTATGNPSTIQLSADGLENGDYVDLVGASGTYAGQYVFEFVDESTISLNGSNYAYTYDSNTQTISINATLGSVVTFADIAADVRSFVCYIAADDSTAYPNGGKLDGYWYELFDPTTLIAENIREGVDIWGIIGTMSAGVDLSGIMGLSKYAVDTFSFSSGYPAVNTKVNHSLNAIPKIALILARGASTTNNRLIAYIAAKWTDTNAGTLNAGVALTSSTAMTQQVSSNSIAAGVTTTTLFIDSINYYYEVGVEYMLITAV